MHIFTFTCFFLVLLIPYASAAAITVDDNDARIAYDGSWTVVADHIIDAQNTNYYGGATHTSTIRGAKATFTFTGTSITYYGDTDIDNADFITELDGVRSTHSAKAPAFQSGQILFTMTGLSNSQHSFSITHNGKDGEWITLDRLVYDFDPAISVVTITSTATQTNQATQATQATLTTPPVSQASSSLSASTTPANNNSMPSGVIIAIIVGSLAGLGSFLFAIWIILRRKSKQKPNSPGPSTQYSSWVPLSAASAPEHAGINYAPLPNPTSSQSPYLPPSYQDIQPGMRQPSYSDSSYTGYSSSTPPNTYGAPVFDPYRDHRI